MKKHRTSPHRLDRRSLRRRYGAILSVVFALAALTASTGRTLATVSVTDFGANGSDGALDTTAIQAANDAVGAEGGGTVVFPAGTYIAEGVRQSSNVEFAGQPGATIKHPNGTSATAIIEGRFVRTRGNISEGSTRVTVLSTAGVMPGAVIAIRGAGGASSVQRTFLAWPIFSLSSSFTVAHGWGWTTNGTNFVLIDDEIISYSGMSGKAMLNIKRAQMGTAKTDHAKDAPVAQLKALYARVTAVGDKWIEIDRPATQAVWSTDVFVGSRNMTIRGLTLDGNKVSGGSPNNPNPLQYRYASGVRIQDNVIRDADHAGVSMDQGTTDSTIEGNTFIDIGTPSAKLGSAIVLYRGSSSNVVRNNTIEGSTYNGIMVDDRTVASTEWDAPSDWNAIIGNQVNIPNKHDTGIYIAGSSGNEVVDNTVQWTANGIAIASTQGIYPAQSQHNTVHHNNLFGHWRGLWVTGSNNTFDMNTILNTTYPVEDTGTGNTFTWPDSAPTPVAATPIPTPTPTPTPLPASAATPTPNLLKDLLGL